MASHYINSYSFSKAKGLVDGSNIKTLVENNKAFGKFVDEKFKELDSDKTGDLSPQELKPAVLGIGGALGLPPHGSSPSTDHIYDEVMKSFLDGRGGKVTKEKFSVVLKDILLGLADGLEREPIQVVVLDGKKLREYAQHSEAEVAAVTTFVENDRDSSGRVRASVLKLAMQEVSVEQGAPPPGKASVPVVESALRRLRVDEESLLDQNEFVETFKRLLMELATFMSEKPLTVAHVEKSFDGSSLRAFLADKKSCEAALHDVWKSLPKVKNGSLSKENVIYALDTVAPKAGLPPLGAVDEMDMNIKEALKMIKMDAAHNKETTVDEEEFHVYLRQVLGGLMLQLEGKPVVISSSEIVNEAQAGNPAAIF